MSRLWHYVQNGKAQGPVPEEQLRALLASGTLRPTDLVWHEGMATWAAIQTIPDLAPQANPYMVPQASVTAPIQLAEDLPGQVPSGAVECLRKTKPWVRFMGVLGAIMMVLMVLGGLAMAAVGGGFLRMMSLPARIGMAALYVVLALLYLPPVLYLHRYANRIGDLVRDSSARSLEEALRAQKSFWKYIGMFTLIAMCLYLLVLLGVLAAGLVMGVGKLF